jgi:peptide deformylase
MTEKVRLVGDPALSTLCAEVAPEQLSAEKLSPLIQSMTETMRAENGVGLAANQIGHTIRLFILRNEDGSVSEYVNPVILGADELVPFQGEGCLSIPGVSTTTKRYNNLTLYWLDRNGKEHKQDFKGMRAFAVQHEMDHLNGKLYLDLFGPVKRDLIMRKYKKSLKQVGRK